MSYKKSGVDEGVANSWVEAIASSFDGAESPLKKQMLSGVGDYASVFALDDTQCLATACDGVGTKLLWTLEGLGSVEDLAQDLLAMTANDLLCVGARPTLFLDYMAVSGAELLKEKGLLNGFVAALAKHCLQTGQLLVGGETAQLPDLYAKGHFDLAGFGVGLLERSEYLDIEQAQPGDQLWAWRSSGPHSNGYSWLRKLFHAQKDAETIRSHLMAPTKLYVNEFNALRLRFKSLSEAPVLPAAYHITGTGFRNLLRKQPKGRALGFNLSLKNLEKAEWVKAIEKRASSSSPQELYETFNMGWGLCLLLKEGFAKAHKTELENMDLTYLGEATDQSQVSIDGLTLQRASL